MIKGISDEGLMENWNERLGQLGREGPQPLTQASTENESFLHASGCMREGSGCK